jgi:hypothetical protein
LITLIVVLRRCVRLREVLIRGLRVTLIWCIPGLGRPLVVGLCLRIRWLLIVRSLRLWLAVALGWIGLLRGRSSVTLL